VSPEEVEEREFTVTGWWVQTGGVFSMHITAGGPVMAIQLFQQEGERRGGTLAVGPVFEGFHDDVSPSLWIDPNVTSQEQMNMVLEEWGVGGYTFN